MKQIDHKALMRRTKPPCRQLPRQFPQRHPECADTFYSVEHHMMVGSFHIQDVLHLQHMGGAAIIHKPSVMILDEATANIDTETEILIQDSLEKMKNIGTMLIVAHRLSTIQHADNIILLSQGEIVEQGNHQELLALKGKYYHLYTLQFSKQMLEGR